MDPFKVPQPYINITSKNETISNYIVLKVYSFQFRGIILTQAQAFGDLIYPLPYYCQTFIQLIVFTEFVVCLSVILTSTGIAWLNSLQVNLSCYS